MDRLPEDSFALMETLVRSRHSPIIARIREIRQKHSMLHEDVLILIYHFAKIARGNILEIGPYLGGSTIVAALGVRDAHESKAIVTVERGGEHKHPRLPSKNILRDLKNNLARERVAELITVVEGYSGDEATVAAVHDHLPRESVGLFIFDADGEIDRDLRLYGDLLVQGAWVVVDDYYSPKEAGKALKIRPRVDALVTSGQLQAMGLYGWGTWIGRLSALSS